MKRRVPMNVTLWIRSRSFAGLALLGVLGAAPALAQTPPNGLPIPTYADFGDPNDQFGSELSADGNWMVATGFFNEAFYVYERNAQGAWTRRQRIVPPTLGQNFFRTPHLAGNRLLITRGSDSTAAVPGSGTLYVYERTSPADPFLLTASLRPSDSQAGDRFGYGLAQTSNRLFVGASGRDEGANVDQGVVYVFINQGGTWVQEARLAPADTGANARFGQDLAFDGQDLIVGAQNHPATPTTRGAAYVFRLLGGTWHQVQKIVEPGTPGSNTRFGYSVTADSGRAFIHSFGFGAYYLFRRDGSGNWGSAQQLPNPTDGTGFLERGVTNSELQGNRLVVTAASAVTLSPLVVGPNYLVSYFDNGSTWQRVSQQAFPADTGDQFEEPVEFAGDFIVAGRSRTDASPQAFDQGAILPFAINAAGQIGAAQPRIYHGSGNVPDRLGSVVAVHGTRMAVLAGGTDTSNGIDRGALHLFRQVGGSWNLVQTIELDSLNEPVCGMKMFGTVLLVARCRATINGTVNRGEVDLYHEQANGSWLRTCALNPSSPSVFGVGTRMAISSAGFWISRAIGTDNLFDSYPLPALGVCPTPTPVPPPSGGTMAQAYFVQMSGTTAAWAITSPSPNASARLLIYDQVAGSWQQSQSITLQGLSAAAVFASEPGLDGNRLAISIQVPIGGIDTGREVKLFERSGGSFALARTLAAIPGFASALGGLYTQVAGNTLLVNDDSMGPNSGVGVYEFSTGNRIDSVSFASIPGIDIEDLFPTLHVIDSTNAVLGWSQFDRDGVNNAGMVFTLSRPVLRAAQGQGWTLAPVESAPRPDRLFSHFFEPTP